MHGGSIKSLVALLACDPQSGTFTKAEHALLDFVAAVNRGGESVTPKWVQNLRNHGWTDVQIAEAIHLTALFATFNRVVNAFGLPSRELLADRSLLDAQDSLKANTGPRLVAGRDVRYSGSIRHDSGEPK